MDGSISLLRQQLEDVRARIKEIEDRSGPLRTRLQGAWVPLEQAKAAYNALKNELMPQIREIEGGMTRADGAAWSELAELKNQEVRLIELGAHRA
jgi:hypothetical protein